MNKPNISADFTIDDIHKIREYNHEQVMSLTGKERKDYYKKRAMSFLKEAGIKPKSIRKI